MIKTGQNGLKNWRKIYNEEKNLLSHTELYYNLFDIELQGSNSDRLLFTKI